MNKLRKLIITVTCCVLFFMLIWTTDAITAEATDKSECDHYFLYHEYVEVTKPDENTWGETDEVCTQCGEVLDRIMIHPFGTYEVTDQNGEVQTIYGWFDEDYEQEVFRLTSVYREENGLNPLSYNTLCQDASDTRALEIDIYFSHTRPDGTRWNTTTANYETNYWYTGGENLAGGQETPEKVMEAWKNSPGHNTNMLRGINDGDGPWRGLSVSCFHQMILQRNESDIITLTSEYLCWCQHFTFQVYAGSDEENPEPSTNPDTSEEQATPDEPDTPTEDGTVMMYRLYNPNSGEHFYTGSKEERSNLVKAGWNYEGNGWVAPTSGGYPVYRLYNPNAGDHHYTNSDDEKNDLIAAGWNYEGVAWNSAEPNDKPLYRLYNPNAQSGAHHYTMSAEEKANLEAAGWNYEGIGWFGQ